MGFGPRETPLYYKVVQHPKEKVIPFHMPGHKLGRGIPEELATEWGRTFELDITSIPGLDLLHSPQGVISEAQNLAARAFGADHSFFLVNGSTCGNHAMILATCSEGDKILVPRNCHASIAGGLILSGAQPVYVLPEVVHSLRLPIGVSTRSIQERIQEEEDLTAALLISPSYYGLCFNMQKTAAFLHRRNIPLLVDEAHGAHLYFHPQLPEPALAQSADMAVHGMHKILASLTQSSILSVRSELVDINRVQAALKILQSTSPSYLLMASLDAARHDIATKGVERLGKVITLASEARKRINRVQGFYCPGEEILEPYKEEYTLDPTKVAIYLRGLSITGKELDRLLRKRYGIQVSFSQDDHLMLLVSIGNTEEDIDALIEALERISNDYFVGRETKQSPPVELFLPVPRTTPREAFFAKKVVVSLDDSLGLVSGEVIAPYPPGIPYILPGEEISSQTLEMITIARRHKLSFYGPQDHTLRTIRVLA